ncbi:HesA/MoeB/ThiF family protein [Kineobactrum salinum]|uniref:Molybdopterin-synthase adenylyltransferase n=1 Tax=Kineobactrum salinum TaxID=2708301 RepID=A0A6C0U571_9GAMM|nr:molybdopterin-synthase adenylyltransferase MoeB [Kineobactrum salinum]QIB66569.1 molybdopterin-synthase adenylyltransferase MoeB [Kineobactrum salinum]
MLTDRELDRYSRQLLLPEFDIRGQEALAAASVLIVGLGGLGCPAAMYLAAAGVGRLLLADGDVVEASNLPRQLAHREARLGVNKAASAAVSLASLNSATQLEVIPRQLDDDTLPALVREVDLVIDASDNFAARFAVNRACIAAGVPLVCAAAIRLEGQLAVFDSARGGGCYRCLYPGGGDDSALSCSTSGVLGPVVGVLGALQALEALKCLTGLAEPLRDGLLVLDLRSLETRRLALPRRSDCPDCGN